MLSIALSLTGIVLFNTLLSLVGHAAITSTLYTLVFTYLLPNEQHKTLRNLKKDIVAGRSELSNTSAQDDFAKWAKIRRRVDKQVGELEALNNALAAHKGQYARYAKILMFILTSGLQWTFTTRHSKAAIVYLPADWFGPMTWFLGLPFAPKGALSCGVYIFLIKRVLGILTRIGGDIYTGIKGNPTDAPTAVPVAADPSSQKPKSAAEKKKQ